MTDRRPHHDIATTSSATTTTTERTTGATSTAMMTTTMMMMAMTRGTTMTDRRPPIDLELATPVRMSMTAVWSRATVACDQLEFADIELLAIAGGQLELGDIAKLANAPLRMTMSRLEGAR